MDYLSENCYLSTLKDNNEMDLFYCGDGDLDDFFHNDSIEPNNKTGCRFLLVDAYNSERTIEFYQHNGFKLLFGSAQQEIEYRRLKESSSLSTRIMYFDLVGLD